MSLLTNRNSWSLLGLPFDSIDLTNTTALIERSIDMNKRCFLSTPNLNFAIAAQSDEGFFQSVVDSDLSVADGMPLIWVAKLLGAPITERVAGSTLFEVLSNKPRANKIKVFFFGGQEGIAERAHQRLNETSAGMTSCGFYDPGFGTVEQMSTPDIIDHINSTKPEFIVVALGAKKGQAWIQATCEHLNAPIISHLGAVINFVAGNVVRAPTLWQRLGFEWLWRIKQEPALWKRYLLDGIAFIKLLMLNVFPLTVYDWQLKKSAGYKKPCTIERGERVGSLITLSGSFKHRNLAKVKEALLSILNSHNADVRLTLDFTEVSYIDGAFIATLMFFQNHLNKQDRGMALKNVPPHIRRILKMNNVINRFEVLDLK